MRPYPRCTVVCGDCGWESSREVMKSHGPLAMDVHAQSQGCDEELMSMEVPDGN